MAEFDTVEIFNPLDEEFIVRWNGEPYRLDGGERRTFPTFLALHIAKHLSDKVLAPEVLKIKAEETTNPYRPSNAQLMVYDNPKRRIALYKILRNRELVEQAVKAAEYKGFVGNMKDYDDYVIADKTSVFKEKRQEVEDSVIPTYGSDTQASEAPQPTAKAPSRARAKKVV